MEHYKSIASFQLKKGKKTYIGSKQNGCRFCGNADATFRNVAHAVPKILESSIILNEECDDCNTFFSNKCEDHFAKFTLPLRALGGTGNGPVYKSKDGNFRVFCEGTQITIHEVIGSQRVRRKEEENTITIPFETQPLIPIEVFRALQKFGLSILKKDDLVNFRKALHWVRYSENQPLMLPTGAFSSMKTGWNNVGLVLVLKLKDESLNIPSHMLILCFGASMISCPLIGDRELSKENMNRKFNLETPYREMFNSHTFLELSSTDKQSVKHDYKFSHGTPKEIVGAG